MTKIDLRQTINIPNLLSLCRLAILPLILFLLISHRGRVAFGVLLLFWATDALDGFLARRLNQETELGKILDPLVDKVCIGLIVLTLAVTNNFPIWLALVIITRDVLILTGSIIVLSSRQPVVSSDVIGKITGICFAGLIAVYILTLKPIMKPMFYITSTLIIVSFIDYSVKFIRLIILKGQKVNEERLSKP
jgi:CDP-diacylglycerol--glycerol-3-phosphate 3-phosphatidyltransferase